MEALKNSVISAKIIELRISGLTVQEAINTVLGAGTYEKLASDLYDELKAKGSK